MIKIHTGLNFQLFVLLKSSVNIDPSACAHDKLQSLGHHQAIFNTEFSVDEHKL